MKTLVIHPDDRTTDFLKKIYSDKDWTIINDRTACRSRKVLTNLIKKHDRIIMMGHGSPSGLFFTAIDSSLVYLLREKECVCIWCNADKFVERYGLKGFYTGMFISEVSEAGYFRIDTSQEKVTYSNDLFAELMKEIIEKPNVLEEIKLSYMEDCPVIKFNNERLYYKDNNDIVEKSDKKLLTY